MADNAEYTYDVCVVGGGLIGSAASKYCARQGLTTLLIAAPEPKREDYGNNDIFGAHYDEARITRRLDNRPFWSHVADQSIKNYHNIETESGVNFYTENGYLALSDANSPYLRDNLDVAKRNAVDIEHIKSHQITPRFPMIKPLPHMEALFEQKQAGSVNPRKLIEAQKILCQRAGGHVVEDVVHRIQKVESSKSEFKIATRSKCSYRARKVLLCVGAFMEHGHLIPPGMHFDVMQKASSAVRIRVSEADADRLSSMPSIHFESSRNFGNDVKNFPYPLSFYMLRPFLYPDGHWYLKAGYSEYSDRRANCTDARAVSDWFKQDDAKLGAQLEKDCKSFVAGLNPLGSITDTCVTTGTPTQHPYIDQIQDGWFVAFGGNGWAAKSSDEIGRIAACLACSGKWDCPFPKEWFRAQYARKAKM